MPELQRMSIAEGLDARVKRAPLIPPRPPLAPDDLSALGRLALIRSNAIASWGPRAYEEDIIRGASSAAAVSSSTRRMRSGIFLSRTTRTIPALPQRSACCGRSWRGPLLAEGKAWKNQRRTLAPAFAPRAIRCSFRTCWPRQTMRSAHCGCKRACRSICAKMQRLALDIAGRTMFSFEVEKHGAALRGFVNEYGERLAQPRFLDLLLPPGWPSPRDISRAMFRRRWTRFMGNLIAERRAMTSQSGSAMPRHAICLI
jgi:unspecific monooxygenase